MSHRPATILLVEDDPGIAAGLTEVLEDEGHEVSATADGRAGLELALTRRWDVVLTDFKLPGLTGLELLRRLQEAKPRLPVILMTAHGTSETAIEATRLGAYDYLLKPFDMPEMIALVRTALASSRLMLDPVDLGEPGTTAGRDAIVGRSRPMQEIFKEIGRIVGKPLTVLIRGETGTGKELIARALYQHSDRARQPFIAVNCAALPETLLESELFGHEKGAFTGADTRRIGRFEQAHGGTLFLDEIGDLAPNTQVKLLRVLQEKTIQRLGGRELVPADARIIAATHRDLEGAMAEGHFRADLYYRISGVTLKLPALRERTEDIPDLVRYFLRRDGREFGIEHPAIHPDALQILAAQPWPGNVRELENAVRKLLLVSRGYPSGVEEANRVVNAVRLPAAAQSNALSAYVSELLAAASCGELRNVHRVLLEAAERELLSQAIKLAQGNQAKAARWLGISRLTMREKLRDAGLHPSQEANPAD